MSISLYATDKTRSCPILSDPTNGKVKIVTFHSGHHKALYFCNDGYQLVGSRSRRCGIYGQWTGSDPICKRMVQSCTASENLLIETHSNCSSIEKCYNHTPKQVLKTRIFYSCNPGYILVGKEKSTHHSISPLECSTDHLICQRKLSYSPIQCILSLKSSY